VGACVCVTRERDEEEEDVSNERKRSEPETIEHLLGVYTKLNFFMLSLVACSSSSSILMGRVCQ
jgi:hypothetical protein